MRLSPRQLAVAIGVSESSLKRWADAGKLAVSRTEGGHRRIAMTEAVRFIRDSGAAVVRPDVLGLDAGAGTTAGARGKRGKTARGAERTPDAREVRGQLVGRFLAGESIAALADGPIAEAVAHIEALRARAARDVKSELAARAAEDAWMQAIAALRGMCDVPVDAPLALGGARATALRSATVAAVLAGEGLRVLDLGAGLTSAVLRAAIHAHRPAITWTVHDGGVDIGGDANERYSARTMAEVAAFARGRTRRPPTL